MPADASTTAWILAASSTGEGWHDELGWYVLIEHDSTTRTRYAHGAHRSTMRVGDRVRRGQVVYLSGSTGRSTGNNLHFELWKRTLGVWHRVDPAPHLTTIPDPPTPVPFREDDDMPRVIRNTSNRALAPNYHGDVALVSPTLLVRKVGDGTYADAEREHGITDAGSDLRFIGLLNQYGWQEADWQAVKALGASNACLRPGGRPYVAGGPTVSK